MTPATPSRGPMTTLPGYVAGTWMIDPVHSEIGFSVRHLMVSKVRGKFTRFGGEIETGERPEDSRVTATIDLDSVHRCARPRRALALSGLLRGRHSPDDDVPLDRRARRPRRRLRARG